MSSGEPMRPARTSLLTGFLGSGMTMLLNHILTAPHGKKLAVIENEFGEAGIGNELLRQIMRMQEEEFVEIMNGYICFIVRQDLNGVPKKLTTCSRGGLKLDGIVIETTGMVYPAPIA